MHFTDFLIFLVICLTFLYEYKVCCTANEDYTDDYEEFVAGPPLILAEPEEVWIHVPKKNRTKRSLNTRRGPKVQHNPVVEGMTWPQGQLFYKIANTLTEDERILLASAMQEIQSKTCLRFHPATVQNRKWIKVYKGMGCFAHVGYNDFLFEHELSLGANCWEKHIIMHELLHCAGFYHEQSRWDRDNYIRVYFENMADELVKKQFAKNKRPLYRGWEQFPYDYQSIMHYDEYAGSGNGRKTMESLTPGITAGNIRRLTEMDVKQANFLYDCRQETETTTSIATTRIPGNEGTTTSTSTSTSAKPIEVVSNFTLFISVHDSNDNSLQMFSKAADLDISSHHGIFIRIIIAILFQSII